jgi:hypothetical protein
VYEEIGVLSCAQAVWEPVPGGLLGQSEPERTPKSVRSRRGMMVSLACRSSLSPSEETALCRPERLENQLGGGL